MEVGVADRTRVYEIVADCERYWRETKVPRGRARDMAVELQSHLFEAQAEGKTPETVVGPDLGAFAEEWASEYRGPASPGAWGASRQRLAWRRDMRSAYGWLAGLAVMLTVIAIIGPKENNVDDVELWRWIWVIGAAALGVGEMLTAGLFMLPFAIGAVAAAILAFANVAVPVQIAVFIGTSILSLWGLQRFAWSGREPLHAVGAKRYVDARATVIEPIDRVAGTGRVRLDTEQWRATTALDDVIEVGTEVKVIDVTGARLVVELVEDSSDD
jgi:membrane protein implicated in regulation of membrane protease activity